LKSKRARTAATSSNPSGLGRILNRARTTLGERENLLLVYTHTHTRNSRVGVVERVRMICVDVRKCVSHSCTERFYRNFDHHPEAAVYRLSDAQTFVICIRIQTLYRGSFGELNFSTEKDLAAENGEKLSLKETDMKHLGLKYKVANLSNYILEEESSQYSERPFSIHHANDRLQQVLLRFVVKSNSTQ
ncbi:hypothetical protein CLF_105375, partial [Clonorchis sinensis]